VTAERNPAQFSVEVIEALATLIPNVVRHHEFIFDPFAGEGTRLGALCDRLGYVFAGGDIEPWRDADSRVALADATEMDSYPIQAHAVVTSPSYNNGCSDSWQPKDDSDRMTYRVAAGRALHPNNSGRYSGRGSRTHELMYWTIHRKAVQWWPSLAIVNVKDSIRAGEVYDLTGRWIALLKTRSYRVVIAAQPACPGQRQNREGTKAPHKGGEAKAVPVIEHESILLAWR
jgi:hypothetical protein